MRVDREIDHAVAILKKKGDTLSLVQAEVLTERMSETTVFNRYVVDAPISEDAGVDEDTFFAARDAAQYLAGKLELEELIPGAIAPKTAAKPKTKSKESVMVPRKLLMDLLRRVTELEQIVNVQQVVEYGKHKPFVGEGAPSDLISQAAACREIGCDKTTVKRWVDTGMIKPYRKNGRVSFSLSELYASEVVRRYVDIKLRKNK